MKTFVVLCLLACVAVSSAYERSLSRAKRATNYLSKNGVLSLVDCGHNHDCYEAYSSQGHNPFVPTDYPHDEGYDYDQPIFLGSEKDSSPPINTYGPPHGRRDSEYSRKSSAYSRPVIELIVDPSNLKPHQAYPEPHLRYEKAPYQPPNQGYPTKPSSYPPKLDYKPLVYKSEPNGYQSSSYKPHDYQQNSYQQSAYEQQSKGYQPTGYQPLEGYHGSGYQQQPEKAPSYGVPTHDYQEAYQRQGYQKHGYQLSNYQPPSEGYPPQGGRYKQGTNAYQQQQTSYQGGSYQRYGYPPESKASSYAKPSQNSFAPDPTQPRVVIIKKLISITSTTLPGK